MERLYQYLWKSGVAGRRFRLIDGRELEVLDPGRLNNDSGPDFFNAKVLIDGMEWVGNVEIHVKSSDWIRHGHDRDRAYDSVMLHVVAVNDFVPLRPDGSAIPQLEIVMPQSFYYAFATLEEDIKSVRCRDYLGRLSPLIVTDWLETLAVERLQSKAQRVDDIHSATGTDWDQTLFITLARAFGFGLNGDPFELTARSLPLNFIYRHGDSPLQIEALLFGQAGMLDPTVHPTDSYYQSLCREYRFLARKYGLSPIPLGMWKYSRSRPQNFPHRRLAFLAALLTKGIPSVKRLGATAGDPEELSSLLSPKLEGYWATHFSFGSEECSAPVFLSRQSVNLLMINAVAPTVYAYASRRGDPELAEKAMELLHLLPGEKNSILRQWEELGFKVKSALRSQALLHLRTSYCDAHKCLYCRFAHQMLKTEAGRACLTPTLFAPIETKKILVAMDSFKGCMSSRDAGNHVARGLRQGLSRRGVGADIQVIPMADGGEGLTQAISALLRGRLHAEDVVGPDHKKLAHRQYFIAEDGTAYIEMAAASGLTLVDKNLRDPLTATTYGTGQLITSALRQGAQHIVVGLGGSATTDAGLGALQALGFRLIDSRGDEIPQEAGGKDMEQLTRIEPPKGKMADLLVNCRFTLACDVNAPMYGKKGASHVFAPQKGATPEEVEQLDRGLRNVARILGQSTPGFDPLTPGFGAAGGIAATLATILDAEIKSGAEIVLSTVASNSGKGDEYFSEFNMMVTGEGSSDRQTLMGKVPVKVLGEMQEECRCVLLAGRVTDRELLLAEGFDEVVCINDEETASHCLPGSDPLDPRTAGLRLRRVAEKLTDKSHSTKKC